jgi:hypothetical protein
MLDEKATIAGNVYLLDSPIRMIFELLTAATPVSKVVPVK